MDLAIEIMDLSKIILLNFLKNNHVFFFLAKHMCCMHNTTNNDKYIIIFYVMVIFVFVKLSCLFFFYVGRMFFCVLFVIKCIPIRIVVVDWTGFPKFLASPRNTNFLFVSTHRNAHPHPSPPLYRFDNVVSTNYVLMLLCLNCSLCFMLHVFWMMLGVENI